MAAVVDESGLLTWSPNPGPQVQFLASTAYEVLYGGAAGGGKSEALLMGALRFAHVPGYRALLLRRTFPELKRSLIERSRTYYGGIPGADYNETDHIWRFRDQDGRPAGVVEFGHLEHEKDVEQYKSAEYQYLGFDELTSFTEYQYRYLLSRLRSSAGIPSRVRSGSNPGGPGHEWVLKRWAPWLSPRGHELGGAPYDGPTAAAGEVLSYLPERGEEGYVAPGTPRSLTRQFIPAKVEDNPALLDNDPEYVARLESLDPISSAQQRHGDWLIKPAPGLLFKRGWFSFLDARPADVERWVRKWDLAATSEQKSRDPDWTVGLLFGKVKGGPWVVADVVRERADPGDVEDLVKTTAELDRQTCGQRYVVHLSQDPGQAGKSQVGAFVRLLAGFSVEAAPETGDKVTRAKPVSAQAKAGNVKLVRGPWNEKFVQELEAFPQKGVHDDQVDALSGAFNYLAPSGVAGTRLLAALAAFRR